MPRLIKLFNFSYEEELYKQAVGIVIKRLRQKSKLSQQKLATITGMRQSTILTIEKGRSEIHLKTFALLAEAFGLKCSHLAMIIDYQHHQLVINQLTTVFT